ncbi:MAG: class I SAM-dependent methyltransferase [Acidimicrobiia bacterium]|nr:class I SAM-dependent methyltransferase [Acidimicrobiia bacterium]MYB73013.1 class I SAM-dependent methyltransferase [Acidimicrobiia bacterium]MYI00130.1 class I SAM-dependent methyltransferase [Acidimicrobiia bacterium]
MTEQPASRSRATELALDKAYATDGPEANRELYAEWADTYDSGFVVDSRYVYPQQVAKVFCHGFAQIDEPVLDVGCGTGIVGTELARLGVSVIDGIDLSPEMLAEAEAKTHDGRPLYRRLFEADLTGPTELADGAYAGIVSAGAFTHGIFGPETISELLRVARPGARFALGINSAHFVEVGFGHWLEERQLDGLIAGLNFDLRPIYEEADEADPDQWSRIAVFAAT